MGYYTVTLEIQALLTMEDNLTQTQNLMEGLGVRLHNLTKH